MTTGKNDRCFKIAWKADLKKKKFSQGTSSTNSDEYANYFNFTLTSHKVMICQLKKNLKKEGL